MTTKTKTYGQAARYFTLMDTALDLEVEACRATNPDEAHNLRLAAANVRNAAKMIGEGKA